MRLTSLAVFMLAVAFGVLCCLPITVLAAEGQTRPLTYLDENGETRTLADYTVVTGETTDWEYDYDLASGWYVVTDDVTINKWVRICNDNEINLLLCDGKTLTINDDAGSGIAALWGEGNNNLRIYGQAEGTGKLRVTSQGRKESGISLSNLYLYGGCLEVDAVSLGKEGEDGQFSLYPAVFGGTFFSWTSLNNRLNIKHTPMEGGVTSTLEDVVPEFRKAFIIEGTNTLASSAKTTEEFTSLCNGKTLIPAYKVLFNPNGGEGDDFAIGVAATGTEKTVKPEDPSREGYFFEGWYTDENGAGEPFSFDTPITQDITLYAKWRQDTTEHTIRIAEGITGGRIEADQTAAAYGEEVTLSVTPDKGYRVGSVKYNGIEITPEEGVYSFIMPTSDVLISAEFETAWYSVSVPSDIWGGTITSDMATARLGDKVTLTVTSGRGNRYDFIPKYVKVNGEEIAPFHDEHVYELPGKATYIFQMPGEDVTVTAKFTAMGECGGDNLWEYDHETGILTISGSSNMSGYDSDWPSPWSPFFGEMTEVVVEEGVQTIGTYAFDEAGLIRTVKLPKTISLIGMQAFHACRSLEEIVIPEGVTRLQANAFWNCSALKRVTIPESVSLIGDWAFRGCTVMEDIYLYPAPEKLDWVNTDQTFFRENKATICHVCPDMLTAYQEKYSSLDVTWQGDLPFGKCGENAWWRFDEASGTIIISGTGKIDDVPWGVYAPWGDYGYAARTVEIRSGITGIGEYCFKTLRVNTVKLPETLTEIGASAFWECANLDYVTLPESLRLIGPNAFMGCSALESIVIPEGVENLPLNVFTNCANLRSVTIPGSVTEIAYNAFSGCAAVRDIYLYAAPEKLTWDAGELNGTGYFKKNRETICHVLPERLEAFDEKFGTGAEKPVNVTFAGDLKTGQRFTVSFNSMGGSAIPSQTVEPGGRVSAPASPPVKEGFAFAGWFSDKSCSQKFLFSYPIREDTTAYAKWIEHIHSFTYSADGATITAGCSAENCPLPEHQAIITLNPPAHETYGDGKAAEALINGDTDVLGSPAVTYRNGAELLEQAPTDAGSYTAQITVGGETVSIAYTIAPKTVSSPKITLEYAEKEYTGEALTPAVLSVSDGGEVIPAYEYEISYYNNTNIGNAAVLLRDREGGNYLVNGTASFKITAARAAITTLPRTTSLTYNGSPQALLLAGASNSENGVEYSTNGKSFGSSIPKQTKPGTYAVYYRAAADEAHLAGDINRLDAVIGRAPLTVSGASAQNRSYNGEKTVVVTAVEINGVIGTEDVSVDTAGLTGTLSSAEAGSYTAVTLPALRLIGEDAGNYVLRQPSRAVPTAVEITPISETTITLRTSSYQKQYLDPAFLLTGISSNVSADIELAVTEGADVIALSGQTVSILKPGAAVITASIEATKNYKGAEAKIRVNVAKAEYPKPQPSASLSVPSSCQTVGNVPLPAGWQWGESDRTKALAAGTTITATAEYVGSDAAYFTYTTLQTAVSIASHTHVEGTQQRENEVKATCTEGGSFDLVTRCRECNEILRITHETTDPLGHEAASAVEERKEPTCTEYGSRDMVVTCSRCGEEISRTHISIPPLGHQTVSSTENRVEPTCTDYGHYDLVIRCKDCDTELNRSTIGVKPLGHDLETYYSEEIPATCTDPGHFDAYVRCVRCENILSHERPESAPALGHHFGEDGVCTDCGAVKLTEKTEFENSLKTAKGDHVVLALTEDINGAKLKFPKAADAKEIMIGDNGHTLGFTGSGSIRPAQALTLKDICVKAANTKGKPQNISVVGAAGGLTLDNVSFEGKRVSVSSTKDDLLLKEVKADDLVVNGSAKRFCTIEGEVLVTTLSGFGELVIDGTLTVKKSLTVNNLTVGADGRLIVEKGAQVNIKNQLFGLGGVIELKEGFKPIKLSGEPVGYVCLESEKTLENMQLFASKQTALEEVIDISAAVPPVEDGEYNYGLYTKSGKVFIYPMKLAMDGKTYAAWADLINAINKAKNSSAEYTIRLLGDVDIGAALRFPIKNRYKALTIDGSGYSLSFTGKTHTLTGNLTLNNVCLSALNRGKPIQWTLKKNKFSLNRKNAELINCTIK